MYTGPNIAKKNLVFGFDTGYGVNNTAVATRNFKGRPATNLAGEPVPVFSNWNGMGGTSEYYTTSEGRRGIHLVTQNGGGVQFYYIPTITNISSSTQYTISAKVKYTGSGSNPHPNLFYVRQYHNGSQIVEGGKFSASYLIDIGDGWYRAYRTFTTESTTSYINLQGYQYNDNMNIKIEDIQLELGNQATPFAGLSGTRSATNSLIDLKKEVDIDLSNVSFDSTGQPTFDGTDDYGSITNFPHIWEGSVSIETVAMWNDNTRSIIFGNYNQGTGGHDINIEKLTTGNLRFYWDRGARDVVSSNNVVTTNGSRYHHVVCIRDTTTDNFKFYVDGELVTTVSNAGSGIYSTGSTFRFGSDTRTGTTVHNGYIPILKIYSKALTATEVKQNYNAYKNRFNI